MTNFLKRLQGAKTYITGIAAILTAVGAYLNHAITIEQAVTACFAAIQTMNLRHAIATAPATPAKGSVRTDCLIILCILTCILGTGCASWNLHAACFDVTGRNLVTPYGPASGDVRFCTESCVGKQCKAPDQKDIESLTNSEIQASKQSLGTIPVTATILPSK